MICDCARETSQPYLVWRSRMGKTGSRRYYWLNSTHTKCEYLCSFHKTL